MKIFSLHARLLAVTSLIFVGTALANDDKNDAELLVLMNKSCMVSFKDSGACSCFTTAVVSTSPTTPQLSKLADGFDMDALREYAKSKAPMTQVVFDRLGTCFK